MKKDYSIIAIIGFVALLFFGFVGLWQSRQVEKKEISETERAQLMRVEFMQAAKKAATMVSDTIEAEREYLIDFELRSSDGKMAMIEQHHLTLDVDDERRAVCREKLLEELESSVNDYWESGKSIELVCTSIVSPDYNEDGSGAGAWEYCDSDADGVWDYYRYC